MTGQAIDHIKKIESLAGAGMSRKEIAVELGLCYEYICQLARYSDAEFASKRANLAGDIRAFAEQGFTRNQICDATGLSYTYVAKLAKDFGIKVSRQKYTGAEPADSKRIEQMAALYKSGKSLNEIGNRYGITRERVRQILTKHRGFSAKDGGQHIAAEQRRIRRNLKRDQRAIEKWGCTWDKYVELRALRKPTRAFALQKRNAATRGIAWELSLWQWWQIWQLSGHWSERGRGRGYQMCRNGDQGPYSVDNVYIADGAVNIQDYWADVKSGARSRRPSSRQLSATPEHKAAVLRAASDRYRKSPKGKLRAHLRYLGVPKAERDAIVAAQFPPSDQRGAA
jgi:DNA-binding CsgD family transcriptional regulator